MPPKIQQSMVARYGVIITYSSLLGAWPRIDELETRLRLLCRTDVVLLIASCSAAVRTFSEVQNNTDDKRARLYLFPFWRSNFENWTLQFGDGYFFSRYTLLWLMRQAVLSCPADGSRLGAQDWLRVFGEACLIANDLSAFPAPKVLQTDLALAANLIPQAEYFSHEDYDRDISRTLYLFGDLAPNAVDTVLPSFAKKLETLVGYSVNEYSDLAFASAIKLIEHSAAADVVESFRLPAVSGQTFALSAISPAAAEFFLNSISGDEEWLHQEIAAAQSHSADFTVFRDRPFLRRGTDYYPLDIGFVLDKAGRSFLWTAIKRCPDDKREGLLNLWGELFERYVSTLLANLEISGGTLLRDTRFMDGAQVADVAIREGTTLILIECKASTISNGIKYADDPAALEKVLESRFVQGEGKTRKGLAQLHHAINRFAGGQTIATERAGVIIAASDIRKIIPVLIHFDNTLRTPGIPYYMKRRFKSLGRVKRFTVTPLVLLPITELEELEDHLSDTPLSEFLESFLESLKVEKTAVFLTHLLPIFRGKIRRRGPTLKRFARFIDEMSNRLFPGRGNATK